MLSTDKTGNIDYFSSHSISYILPISRDGNCFYFSLISSPLSVIESISNELDIDDTIPVTQDIREYISDILTKAYCKPRTKDIHQLRTISGVFYNSDSGNYYIINTDTREPVHLTESYINSSVREDKAWNSALSDLLPSIISKVFKLNIIIHRLDKSNRFFPVSLFSSPSPSTTSDSPPSLHLIHTHTDNHYTLGIHDDSLEEYRFNPLYKDQPQSIEDFVNSLANSLIEENSVFYDSFAEFDIDKPIIVDPFTNSPIEENSVFYDSFAELYIDKPIIESTIIDTPERYSLNLNLKNTLINQLIELNNSIPATKGDLSVIKQEEGLFNNLFNQGYTSNSSRLSIADSIIETNKLIIKKIASISILNYLDIDIEKLHNISLLVKAFESELIVASKKELLNKYRELTGREYTSTKDSSVTIKYIILNEYKDREIDPTYIEIQTTLSLLIDALCKSDRDLKDIFLEDIKDTDTVSLNTRIALIADIYVYDSNQIDRLDFSESKKNFTLNLFLEHYFLSEHVNTDILKFIGMVLLYGSRKLNEYRLIFNQYKLDLIDIGVDKNTINNLSIEVFSTPDIDECRLFVKFVQTVTKNNKETLSEYQFNQSLALKEQLSSRLDNIRIKFTNYISNNSLVYYNKKNVKRDFSSSYSHKEQLSILDSRYFDNVVGIYSRNLQECHLSSISEHIDGNKYESIDDIPDTEIDVDKDLYIKNVYIKTKRLLDDQYASYLSTNDPRQLVFLLRDYEIELSLISTHIDGSDKRIQEVLSAILYDKRTFPLRELCDLLIKEDPQHLFKDKFPLMRTFKKAQYSTKPIDIEQKDMSEFISFVLRNLSKAISRINISIPTSYNMRIEVYCMKSKEFLYQINGDSSINEDNSIIRRPILDKETIGVDIIHKIVYGGIDRIGNNTDSNIRSYCKRYKEELSESNRRIDYRTVLLRSVSEYKEIITGNRILYKRFVPVLNTLKLYILKSLVIKSITITISKIEGDKIKSIKDIHEPFNKLHSLEHFTPTYHIKHISTNQDYIKDIEEINNRHKNKQLTGLDVCMYEKEYVERSIEYLEKYMEEEHEARWEFNRSEENRNINNRDLNNTTTPLEKEFVSVYGVDSTRDLIRDLISALRSYLSGKEGINDRIQSYTTTSYKKPFNFFAKYISSKEAKKEIDKCRDKDQAKDKELAKSSSKKPNRSSSSSSTSVRR